MFHRYSPARTLAVIVMAVMVLLVSCRKSCEPDSFSKALPVWAEGRESEQNLTLSFRCVVKGRRASLIKIAASTDYRLLVNGEFVSHGPCVAAHGHYRIDCIDLSSMLSNGENVIGIEVCGYNQSSYYLLNQPSFLQAELCTAGGRPLVWTGGAFEAYELSQRVREVPRFCKQRSFAEEYVLDADYLDWALDPAWTGPGVKLSVQPCKTVLARGVAYPDYTLLEARHIADSPEIATCLSGKEVVSPDFTRDDTWKFQHNSTGFPGMDITVHDSCRVKLLFDELLQSDGSVDAGRMKTLGCVKWTLSPGRYRLESFEPYTMQYLQLEVEGGRAEVDRIWLRQYVNSDVGRAEFHSGNAELDELFESARRTAAQNYLDIFMDCPSRERAGWLCDSYFSARAAFDLCGNCRIERNFLENFLLAEHFEGLEEGMLPMCYPSDHSGFEARWNYLNCRFIPNWSMFFVLELEEYLHRSGDRELVDRARGRVLDLLAYFKKFENEFGLLEGLHNWVFVEWSDAANYVQDVSYPTNMLYAKMLESVGKLYSIYDLTERAESVRRVIREQSYDGKFFCDNALRRDGKLIFPGKSTEVCQYYAFAFGTATRETYPELWATLRDEFCPGRVEKGLHPTVSPANAFIGTFLRLEMLSEAGLSERILSESLSEYIRMSRLTGTLWEHLTATASCNHGFAAHLIHVFYRDILGVYDIDPVGKTVTIRIRESGLEACRGRIPIGKEYVEMEWTRSVDGTYERKLRVPRGYRVKEI